MHINRYNLLLILEVDNQSKYYLFYYYRECLPP